MFACDLFKQITVPCEIQFVRVKSYRGTARGSVSFLIGIDDIENRRVIVIEDIVDSGNTMKRISDTIEDSNVKSCEIASLLCRLSSSEYAKFGFKIDYCGFDNIGDAFVYGYGLDVDQQYRQLPDIYINE